MLTGPPPKFHETRDILRVGPRLDCMGMSGVLVYRNNKPWCSRKPAISQEPVTYSGSVW